MIDLRKGLGAPPIAFPGVRMSSPGIPAGTPGSAPILTANVEAARALSGCAGCNRKGSGGIAGLAMPWYAPMWVKGMLIAGGAVALAAMTYGIYRAVR